MNSDDIVFSIFIIFAIIGICAIGGGGFYLIGQALMPDNQTHNQTQAQAPQPVQNYTTICCPNPNCRLHDPKGFSQGSGAVRPILVNTYTIDSGRGTSSVRHTYLCEECGAEWSDQSDI